MSSETRVDCGQITVEFFNDNESKSSLDIELFLDNRSVEPYRLTTLTRQETSLVGTYPIKYRVFYTSYPMNTIELESPFTITVLDPCDMINSITVPTLSDQTYTITDEAKIY